MNRTVFFVSPLILVLALFRVIETGLTSSRGRAPLNYYALNFAGIIIAGIVSIAVVEVALRMGALPKPPKGTSSHKA